MSPTTAPLHVLVAGAGIGGLTLAAALRKAGLRPTVFERAPALQPVGAGLTVQANAMAALATLGLADAVAAQGAQPREVRILTPEGRVLVRQAHAPVIAKLGHPMVCVHRARLQAVLHAAAGEGAVQLGRAVTGFTQDAQGVEVALSDGTTARGDVLVGADGLRSAVRAGLLGDAPLRYSGYTSWRGLAPHVDGVDGGLVTETWGAGARFGVVPLGHGEVYWFCTLNAPAGGQDTDAGAELLARFCGWHAPIAALLRATPPARILRTDIHDRPPVDRWTRGRVALLGDAAHPMTPNLGQGGCQAIEDAVVLARALAAGGAVQDALAAYAARRIPRANAFVRASERVGRVAQLEGAVGRGLRNGLMRVAAPLMASRQLEELRFRP